MLGKFVLNNTNSPIYANEHLIQPHDYLCLFQEFTLRDDQNQGIDYQDRDFSGFVIVGGKIEITDSPGNGVFICPRQLTIIKRTGEETVVEPNQLTKIDQVAAYCTNCVDFIYTGTKLVRPSASCFVLPINLKLKMGC